MSINYAGIIADFVGLAKDVRSVVGDYALTQAKVFGTVPESWIVVVCPHDRHLLLYEAVWVRPGDVLPAAGSGNHMSEGERCRLLAERSGCPVCAEWFAERLTAPRTP